MSKRHSVGNRAASIRCIVVGTATTCIKVVIVIMRSLYMYVPQDHTQCADQLAKYQLQTGLLTFPQPHPYI